MRKLLVYVSVIGVLAAQAPNPAPQQGSDQGERPTFQTSVKEVMAPVTVTDRDGHIVNNLSPLDFQLFDNGKPQKFTMDLAQHPISLVVAVQANAATEKILKDIRKIGSLFDSLVLGENGEIAVLAFDHEVKTMTGFTSDPDKIHDAFVKLKPGSWTSALNDATVDGLNMLRSRPANRRRIMLLMSESRDKGSSIKVRDVLTEAEFADIVIYSVDISHLLTSLTSTPTPPRPNPIPPGGQTLPGGNVVTPQLNTQLNNNGNYVPLFKEMFILTKAIFVPNPLEVYTKFTGGREYSFMTQRGLEQAVADIGEELHSQYLLTYSPNNQNEAGFHEIEVRVAKPDLRVRTRNGYWLAGKPQ